LLLGPAALDPRPVTACYEYKGVVSGEAILGANAFRDMFAGIRDIVGGRSAAYERELSRGDLRVAGRPATLERLHMGRRGCIFMHHSLGLRTRASAADRVERLGPAGPSPCAPGGTR
jgi:hypothetical protein